jgi:hypothetical protein
MNNYQTSLLLVDSADRVSGISTNFQIILNEGYRIRKVDLVSATIPNNLYNVTNQNNTFQFQDNAGPYNITIPIGIYDITTFCSEVQTLMNAIGTQTYSVSYSNLTTLITISAASSFQLLLSTSTAYQLLGFLQSNFTGSNSYTGTQTPGLNINDYLYLNIAEFTSNQINTNSQSNRSTFIIPNTVSSGNYITYNENSYFKQSLGFTIPINISKLTVTLQKRNNSFPQCDLHNLDFTFILRIQYE